MNGREKSVSAVPSVKSANHANPRRRGGSSTACTVMNAPRTAEPSRDPQTAELVTFSRLDTCTSGPSGGGLVRRSADASGPQLLEYPVKMAARHAQLLGCARLVAAAAVERLVDGAHLHQIEVLGLRAGRDVG